MRPSECHCHLWGFSLGISSSVKLWKCLAVSPRSSQRPRCAQSVAECELGWNMPDEHWIHRHMVAGLRCVVLPRHRHLWTWSSSTQPSTSKQPSPLLRKRLKPWPKVLIKHQASHLWYTCSLLSLELQILHTGLRDVQLSLQTTLTSKVGQLFWSFLSSTLEQIAFFCICHTAGGCLPRYVFVYNLTSVFTFLKHAGGRMWHADLSGLWLPEGSVERSFSVV